MKNTFKHFRRKIVFLFSIGVLLTSGILVGVLPTVSSAELNCTPPEAGDWIITEDCTFAGSATLPASTQIKEGAILTLTGPAQDALNLICQENGHTLTTDTGSHVFIKPVDSALKNINIASDCTLANSVSFREQLTIAEGATLTVQQDAQLALDLTGKTISSQILTGGYVLIEAGGKIISGHFPTAIDDNVATEMNAPIKIDALGGNEEVIGDEDYDLDLNPFTFASFTQGTNGTVQETTDTIEGSDGSTFTRTFLEYTPQAEFQGTDTFTYTIADIYGLKDTAKVTVTVGNVKPGDAYWQAGTENLLYFEGEQRVGIGTNHQLPAGYKLYVGKTTGETNLKAIANNVKIQNDVIVDKNTVTQSATLRGKALVNRVQIGTAPTIPEDYVLSVSGKILVSEEVRVEHPGVWADYVFAEDYQLRSLQELETYIREQQHLPNMPAAEEVAAKGIGLGNLQAKLLQNIEELTLDLIEQEKRISAWDEQERAQLAELEQIIKSI